MEGVSFRPAIGGQFSGGGDNATSTSDPWQGRCRAHGGADAHAPSPPHPRGTTSAWRRHRRGPHSRRSRQGGAGGGGNEGGGPRGGDGRGPPRGGGRGGRGDPGGVV